MMTRRNIFTTRWSNVGVAESVASGVTVPPPGALVENESVGFAPAASGRLCVPDRPGVFWVNLPRLPGELFAGFANGGAGVPDDATGFTGGEAGAPDGAAGDADGRRGAVIPGLAPELFP